MTKPEKKKSAKPTTAHKKAGGPWGRVRADAHRIDLLAEGAALFLYDEAHTTAIAGDLPRHPGSVADPAHARLARAGRLVTVLLEGDGAARAELAVGAPLTGKERASMAFLDPQEALLDLPSGRLHVETPSTIPIPRIDPDAAPGFVTDVPPGRYRLTVYRRDWTRNKREQGPHEFLTLTPLGKGESVPTPAVVPWPEEP